jgi:hypothetical protein
MLDFLKHWQVIAALIIGLYEVVVRLFPSLASISIIKFIVDLLKWLSDKAQAKKK